MIKGSLKHIVLKDTSEGIISFNKKTQKMLKSYNNILVDFCHIKTGGLPFRYFKLNTIETSSSFLKQLQNFDDVEKYKFPKHVSCIYYDDQHYINARYPLHHKTHAKHIGMNPLILARHVKTTHYLNKEQPK